MANFTLNNMRISLRNDLAATWTSVNPVLLKGEIGIEIDTGKFKFGDGSKQWNALKYASTDDVRVQELIDASVEAAKTELKGYADQAEADAISTADSNADSKIAAKIGELGEEYTTVKEYVDAKDTELSGKIDGKADKATTLAGYGITDAMTATAIGEAISTAKQEAIGMDASMHGEQAYPSFNGFD